MLDVRQTKSHVRDPDSVEGRLKRSFSIKEIDLSDLDRFVLKEFTAGHRNREKFLLGGQRVFGGARGKHLPHLKQFQILPLMIKIYPNGIEKPGQHRWPHSDCAFDDSVS